ncbi:uncharacterized protein DUF3606 [Novosphingobium sp. PhB55]|uniref:DUF3606 domain-containing protein n=1 Tax=Novosphingobium sp. PhB55 TaxID=2485106 RepID=UPI00106605E7|nr:DUF3606 domain-containing protein [Novosphingobium sp. PhB55]TDW61547.1 uncharacterized protein DUF3606 [Novosphingobium sp. PhB55]
MANNGSDSGPVDRSRISLHSDSEIAYWTDRLQISRAKLESAVKVVGPQFDAVFALLMR